MAKKCWPADSAVATKIFTYEVLQRAYCWCALSESSIQDVCFIPIEHHEIWASRWTKAIPWCSLAHFHDPTLRVWIFHGPKASVSVGFVWDIFSGLAFGDGICSDACWLYSEQRHISREWTHHVTVHDLDGRIQFARVTLGMTMFSCCLLILKRKTRDRGNKIMIHYWTSAQLIGENGVWQCPLHVVLHARQ